MCDSWLTSGASCALPRLDAGGACSGTWSACRK